MSKAAIISLSSSLYLNPRHTMLHGWPLKIFSLSIIKLSKNKSMKNNNDDAQKTNRPNAPYFDGMVVVRKAWKEENNRSKMIEVNRPKTLQCLS